MKNKQERNIFQKFSDILSNLNLYDEKNDLSLVDQILSTRIFLILFTISISIITMLALISVQTQTITITSPSEIVFESLSQNYRSTLSCPCTQTSISQKHFISFNPQYHSICSSQWTNHSFISLYLSDAKMSEYWQLDYCMIMASHFQLLALFCQTIRQTITDRIDQLSSEHIISNKVLFRDVFDAQILSLIQQIQINIKTNYKQTRDFISFNIHGNGIYSGLRTNRMIETDVVAGIASYSDNKYQPSNGSCSCQKTNDCTYQAGIYNYTGQEGMNISLIFGYVAIDPPLLFSIPGLFAGCLPYNSLLKSTLECFFNQTCIDLFQIFINRSLSFISPLSSSYFQTNTTVNNLLNELLIESWNDVSNFTNYYKICAPLACTYSFDQRFNILYVILTLISLFGGLRIITYFSAPFIVSFIRHIEAIKWCQRHSIDDSPNASLGLKERLFQLRNQIHEKIRTLNLFPSLSNIQNGIYSTRLYLSFLLLEIVILVFYMSISIRIRTITIYQPTLKQYEQFFDQYSSSLVCPCSQLSIPHSTILNIQPYYHQICSSDFIQDDFLSRFIMGLARGIFIFDFRMIYAPMFSLLKLFCLMANETITSELIVFYDTQFISGQILANETFHSQISILIQQFKNQVIGTYLELFQLVRYSTQLNQFFVSKSTNAHMVVRANGNLKNYRFSSTNTYDNNCSCGTNSSCTRPQGFYCRSTGCFKNLAKPNYTIPGLLLSCLPVDSLIVSSLECFYNLSCIQTMIQLFAFDTPNITISPTIANITPLNSLIDSRFSMDTTLVQIISHLFIEYWIDSISFTNYYNQCAPIECTYTYEERFNFAYIFSTILGIVGGLSVMLKIMCPLIVKTFRRIYHRYKTRERQYININFNIINYFQQLNLYEKNRNDRLPEILLIYRQKLATRFYIVIFCLSMIVMLIFTSLNIQNYSVVVSSPSESTFELLKSQYSSTISCPCLQIATPYSTFLSVNVSAYHQICSSDFVSSNFIQLMWGNDDISAYFDQMDRKILSSQFRFLSSLCSLSKDVIDRKRDIFLSKKFFTVETLTYLSFQTQIDSIIKTFINQISVDFRRELILITDLYHANQLQNIFNTNWGIPVLNTSTTYILPIYPVQFNETDRVCSCATSAMCKRSVFNKGNDRKTIDGKRKR